MSLFNLFTKKNKPTINDIPKKDEKPANIKEILTKRIFEKSVDCAQQVKDYIILRDGKEAFKEQELWVIIFEFQAAFLQFVDILAYSILGGEKRTDLITVLRNSIVEANVAAVYSDRTPEKQNQIKASLLKDLNNFSRFYSQFKKFFPKEDEPAEGTFFWEFGSRLAEGLGYKDDIKFISLGIKLAAEAIRELEVEEALHSI